MSLSKGAISAQQLLDEFGIDDIQEIDIRDLVYARGIILNEKPLHNSDGRIVFGKKSAIITINSDISYAGRKRFTVAHELGHFEMHRHLHTHLNDNAASLECFKTGHQETEANEFATELLMPKSRFVEKANSKRFSPELLRELADYFNTSITSVAFRYLELGGHPIFIFHSYNGNLLYWKCSSYYSMFEHFLKAKDLNRLPVPENSVAAEYFNDKIIYRGREEVQPITKDVWFETKGYDNDEAFNEFCIVTPTYNTVVSIVWTVK